MKNLKINYDKFTALRGTALVLVIVTMVASLTGCGKKADCNVGGKHAHLYTNEEGYVRYIEDEHLRYEGYDRNEEYISIEGQEKLYNFLDKKNLMRIDDNLEVIQSIQDGHCDYTEYRYRYTYLQPIPHTRKVGKTTTTYFTYIPMTRYSWTSNPDHSRLTGETRLCRYVYVAYKVEVDERGKYVLIPSPQVDDLTTVMDEYPYVKEKFYKVVNIYGEEVDYEDGKEEDLSEEDKRRQQEYEESQPKTQSYNNSDAKTLVKRYQTNA